VVVDTDAVLRLVEEVAAEVVTPRFRSLADGQVHEKNPGDLVTVADHEAETLLTRALADAYPDAVVLGEEAYAGDRSLLSTYAAAPHAFTIDPVDGTKNFVHGSPDHAVMVSESRDGAVVRAWIWQPQHRLAYVAERGAGAFRNGERLRRRPPSADRSTWRGVTSRRKWIGRELDGLRPLELTWICCGVDYPQLVEGNADFVLYGAGKPWDHAPGSLLLIEAGAHLGTFDGTDYAPQGPPARGLVAAADRATYDEVVGLL
jgi:fructose-1,6-bisphosphatase/inositol monophosphatase family enzyme